MPNVMKFAAIAAAGLALSSCLTSEGLLFTQKNARALPLEAGVYESCQIEEAAAPDCKTMTVSHDASGLYRMAVEGEDDDVTFARHKRIMRGAYATQLWGPDDDDPFYFLTTVKGEERVMSMIACEGLPKDFRERYVANGQMTVEESASACIAKTPGAIVAAARAWLGSDAHKTGPRIVFKRKS